MIRTVLGLSVGLVFQSLTGWCQDYSRVDSIPVDSFCKMHEFRVNVPLGLTFINSGHRSDQHHFRFHYPNNRTEAHLRSDTLGRLLRTSVALLSSNSSTYVASMSSSGGQVKMRGSMTVNEDPTHYLTEVKPAVGTPLAMGLQLGYGDAWLDLTDLDVRAVDIQASDANVFLSYKKANRHRMTILNITSGMSRIFLRNLELARADHIKVDNGMGDTKIIVGADIVGPSRLDLGVGAGACVMMVHKDAPMKLILKNTFLSTVEIPENFIKSGNSAYVNLAYKKDPVNAITVVVDMGIGSFSLISYL